MVLQNIGRNVRRLSQVQNFVRIVEVGPRDGLQNEPAHIPADVKVDFINKLSETGLSYIESVSFVSPKWVPQMGDGIEVYTRINKKPSVTYSGLVPNIKGLETALSVGVKEIAAFLSPTEGFSKNNTNCTMEEGLQRAKTVTEAALKNSLKVRGYVSTVVGCPYDGSVKPSIVAKLTENLLSFGCHEVSLGDTIGVGTISNVTNLLKEVLKVTTPDNLAVHFHDTYGQALVNILVSLDHGVRVVDSSVSGLGGCPYAPGATGNVATEDLVYMLHGLGAETGVDLKKLIEVGHFISEHLKKPTNSKVNRALHNKYFKN